MDEQHAVAMRVECISPSGTHIESSPDGIRTRATALRGRRARPLHNGALACMIIADQTAEAYQFPCDTAN
ncbi:MAG: hypothetical protein K0S98_2372 [Propionibacteriaceae bacterium]|nr:hypothetical protein [Propionibacteriaceae bacterium]